LKYLLVLLVSGIKERIFRHWNHNGAVGAEQQQCFNNFWQNIANGV
jgi:hypothetical protein